MIAAIWLLHSPNLVAIGLPVAYETWSPIGWHHLYLVGMNIDWDCLVPHCIMGSPDQWEFLPFFRPKWQTRRTVLTAGKCLQLGLCRGTLKESSMLLSCYSIDVSYQAGGGSRANWIKMTQKQSQIAKFMGPTWGPTGSSRPQMGPMLTPWTLLLGSSHPFANHAVNGYENGQDMGSPLTNFIGENNLKLILQELWQKGKCFFYDSKVAYVLKS